MRDVYADTPDSARYAGFWIRVAANVLDVLIIAAINQVLLFAIGGWSMFAGVIPPLIIIGSWIALGASPGKMMCRIRIVDEPTGGRPTAWQCIGRYVMAVVGALCVGLGFLRIAIDPRRQGWHDQVVRTFVVRRG